LLEIPVLIPQNLMYKKGTNETRKEMIQELLSNDLRSKSQQVWTLELQQQQTTTTTFIYTFSTMSVTF